VTISFFVIHLPRFIVTYILSTVAVQTLHHRGLESARTVKERLAARLRELRKARGWSQERLAEEASMHRTYLAGIERSLRNPSLENLNKLANALGVSIPQLFEPASQPQLARPAAVGNPRANKKAGRKVDSRSS
jgi:ribosome-binding protein aMBF1 (putative translation factor)